MKTEKPSNLKAFANDWNIEDGMTLRDYFANSAMQGIIISDCYKNYTGNNGLPVAEFVAIEAYSIADAMLKQREL